MKRLIIILILLLALPCYGQDLARLSAPMMGAGVVAAATCGASFAEDNFDRADSGTAAAAGWGETDTGSLLAISGNTLAMTHSATTSAYVSHTKADAVTEGYIRFKFKVSSVATGGNAAASYIFGARDVSDNFGLWLSATNDAAGNWTGLTLAYKPDTGTASVGSYTLSPADNTWYWFKIYWKAETSADASDGIAKLWTSTDGTTFTERISSTTLDFTTYADLKYLRIGNAFTSGWTSTTITKYWDDAEWRSDDCFD